MSILDYLSSYYPVAKPSDTGIQILELMNTEAKIALPIVDEDNYLATIKKEDILIWQQKEHPISETELLNFKPLALDTSYPYDVAILLKDLKIPMLPIVDETFKYLGVVTPSDLFYYFCENSELAHSGGVLILSIKPNDYSLSEIARICESNNTIILNVQIVGYDKDLMDVILKTNTQDLQSLEASFVRYDYTIKEVYGAFKKLNDNEDRFKLLMNYINM